MVELNPWKRGKKGNSQTAIPMSATVAHPVTEATLSDAYKAEFKGHTLNRRFDDLNSFRFTPFDDHPTTEQDIANNQILVGHGEGALGQTAKLIPDNWYAQVNFLRRATGKHVQVEIIQRQLKLAMLDKDAARIRTLQERLMITQNRLAVLRAICDTIRIEQIPRTIYEKDREVNVVTKNDIDPQLLIALLMRNSKDSKYTSSF